MCVSEQIHGYTKSNTYYVQLELPLCKPPLATCRGGSKISPVLQRRRLKLKEVKCLT